MAEVNGADLWALIIAGLALIPTFTTAIILPLGRWIANHWRGPYIAERDLRRKLEAKLLETEKKCVLLEVKLQYCEGRLGTGHPGEESD